MTLAVLWTDSFPGGGDFVVILFAVYALVASALLWFLRLGGWLLVRRKRSRPATNARRFLIAPIGGLLTVALILAGAPLATRFAMSRSAFEDALSWRASDVTRDRRVGLYTITDVERAKGNVLFYEKHGAFLGEAGFAYLPHGPGGRIRNRFGEYPSFSHVFGTWYTWTAGD